MRLALVVAVLALAGAGCGFGSGDESGEVTLTVTRDFGTEELGNRAREDATEGDTIMRLLERTHEVETRFGGGFVQQIDGVSGVQEAGRRADWFFYVNGIESSVGAAERRVSPGDRVWWDHHDWGATMRIPAVVGSFPEPLLSGSDGKRFPIRLVCAGDTGRSCDEVATRLEQAGVEGVARALLEQSPGEEVVRVLVGRWADVRRDDAARQLEDGPSDSGVYVRFGSSGTQFEVLDPKGRRVRSLGAGSGLVAATAFEGQAPTWVVTGTDEVGVAAAAAAFTEDRLEDRFALAIDAGQDVPLPVTPPSRDP
jgi:Domain of unknown function (DUF4430)